MIDYFKGVYSLNLLLRVHGSALYKGSIAGFFSVLIYLAVDLHWNRYGRHDGAVDLPVDDLEHPYGIGVLVSSVGFLIVFRANYGYQRYWEACTAVHHFMSKWCDATMQTAVFHLQSSHYDGVRPHSFFDHDELNTLNLTRERRRGGEEGGGLKGVNELKSVYNVDGVRNQSTVNIICNNARHSSVTTTRQEQAQTTINPTNNPSPEILQRIALNAQYFPSAQVPKQSFASRPNNQTPPLFLQELAHLSSLLCAVALSTLRNDIEEEESPLGVYVTGMPWPASDPDQLPKATKEEFQHKSSFLKNVRYWSGIDRTPHHRSKYNATRPFLIIGGVSDNEIAFLQKARGPHAKTQLAWAWLSDFIVREHLAGSLGEVHSAIISRLVQMMSDGSLLYNQARKIMYISFPFPHAQLAVFYTLMMIPAVPFLMEQYTNAKWIGCLLTFLTVTCLVGLHEVARELSNPFRNMPNELPLCTFQAMYNEALCTMFAGYNPDSYWDPEAYQGRWKRWRWERFISAGTQLNVEVPAMQISQWRRLKSMTMLSRNCRIYLQSKH
eukprot:g5575.t1 g5575   contig2:835058-836716(+)